MPCGLFQWSSYCIISSRGQFQPHLCEQIHTLTPLNYYMLWATSILFLVSLSASSLCRNNPTYLLNTQGEVKKTLWYRSVSRNKLQGSHKVSRNAKNSIQTAWKCRKYIILFVCLFVFFCFLFFVFLLGGEKNPWQCFPANPSPAEPWVPPLSSTESPGTAQSHLQQGFNDSSHTTLWYCF